MSDTTATFGNCFACGRPLQGGYTMIDGYYFHSFCAPVRPPAPALPPAVVWLDAPLPDVLKQKDEAIATLRATVARLERELEQCRAELAFERGRR